MNAVLDGLPETALRSRERDQCPNAPAPGCAECLCAFERKQRGQLFCSVKHKRAYNNRWLKRGAVLAPLQAAARATRNGTRGDRATGKKASRDANLLLQRWREEDARAGRMDVVEYVSRRYRFGLVEVV